MVLLWLTPVAIWTVKGWPIRAGIMDRGVLAADLLLPDLVALGARERYLNQLNELKGFHALCISVYRLIGWLIISIVFYVVVKRAGY